MLVEKVEMFSAIQDSPIRYVEGKLKLLFDKISQHSLFSSIATVEDFRIFTEHHVYAVWDFMCLVKNLQSRLTTVTVPWFPPQDALGSHLINEILVDEEGDINHDGRYLSHYEIYIEAMEQLGANTARFNHFLNELKRGETVTKMLQHEFVPEPAKHFVLATFSFFDKPLHQTLAAFVFGREDLTFRMFIPILNKLEQADCSQVSVLKYYLERHIELDGNSHSEKGFKLLRNLCGQDIEKWDEVVFAAEKALEARLTFLDGIYATMRGKMEINSA